MLVLLWILISLVRIVLLNSHENGDFIDVFYSYHVDEMTVARENFIPIGPDGEPGAQGCFLMLEPNHHDVNRIIHIINKWYKSGVKRNIVEGWCHKITTPDHWVSVGRENQTEFDLYATCAADQGLLLPGQNRYHFYYPIALRSTHNPFIESFTGLLFTKN
mmetsp:Transcript_6572/g.12383  ORF Transcript_6572/g.12383 Transcript_6572/m.12383 type:complete len:161 (-) Transcript_6572:85-567(-)